MTEKATKRPNAFANLSARLANAPAIKVTPEAAREYLASFSEAAQPAAEASIAASASVQTPSRAIAASSRPPMFDPVKSDLVELAAKGELYEVQIADIDPDPKQPRKTVDKVPLETLKDTIRQMGVLQPPMVRPHPHLEGRFMIVFGERRIRCCQELGHKTIFVLIKAMDDRKARILQVIENLETAKENVRPWEQAAAVAELVALYPSQQNLCDDTGMTREYVSKRMQLFALPTSIKELHALGILTDIETSLELGRLHQDYPKVAAELIAQAKKDNRIRRDDVKRARKRAAGGGAPAPKGVLPAFEPVADQVRQFFARIDHRAKVATIQRGRDRKSVKMELVFDNAEAMQAFANTLANPA